MDGKWTWNRRLLKTLWEMEKMLATSIFSFSHSVFYPFQTNFQYFIHIFFCPLQMLSIWTTLRFCPLVKSYYTGPSFTDSEGEAYETIVRNWEENAYIFFFSPQCFLPFQKTLNLSSPAFNIYIICFLESTLHQTIQKFLKQALFLRDCSTSLFKTLWEKEKFYS